MWMMEWKLSKPASMRHNRFSLRQQGAYDMKVTTISIDLVKNIFQRLGITEQSQTAFKAIVSGF
jgi:hypothetical protein